MVKKIIQAIVIDFVLAFLTLSIVICFSLNKYFWGFIAFLIALGNLLFSKQIDDVTSSIFKKPGKSSKIGNSISHRSIKKGIKNKRKMELNKSFRYIEYNVYVAVIALVYFISNTDKFEWGMVISETGLTLVLFGLVLFILPWVKRKFNSIIYA